jgi:hypothetical protein
MLTSVNIQSGGIIQDGGRIQHGGYNVFSY